ncbi:hypothetical protein GWK47_005767 [Chionoecetes opilio]|uniref:Uncharacterized protein n=1 Tax=Chionoecetes opilio TaxID=41210 RepID=A0A8J5CJA7_CHIOP|nr:hypothetical protein GWK47_005767 [Chionoecetes opilio]
MTHLPHPYAPPAKVATHLARPRNNLRRQCWPASAAEAILTMGIHETLLSKGEDFPHPNFATPPPWSPPPITTSLHSLDRPKAHWLPVALRLEMLQVLEDLTTPASLTIFTDGSVDPATGAAGAAFVSGQTTKQWRLTDGASCLQAELIAIRGALPTPWRVTPLMSSYTQTQNPLSRPSETHSHRTTFTSLPPLFFWPSDWLHQHEATVALSSPSASWYAAATAYHPLPQDPSIAPHVRDRLHRLRLGFPCVEEIRQGAMDITCYHCQVTSSFALQHYLLKCEATSHIRERLPPHTQPGHPGAAAAAAAFPSESGYKVSLPSPGIDPLATCFSVRLTRSASPPLNLPLQPEETNTTSFIESFPLGKSLL